MSLHPEPVGPIPEETARVARAGIEYSLAQGLRVCDLRRARYVGLAKTRPQHVLTAAEPNVRRLGAWWDERPFTPTRRAAFLVLAT